jgi:hypothetical protein
MRICLSGACIGLSSCSIAAARDGDVGGALVCGVPGPALKHTTPPSEVSGGVFTLTLARCLPKGVIPM